MGDGSEVRGVQPIPVGHDGIAVLAVSSAIIAVSLGLTWLGLMLWVAWTALRVRTRTAETPGADGPILVLGHRLLPDGTPSAAFQARLARVAALWRAAAHRRVVVLGGSSRPGQQAEAAVGREALVVQGVPPGWITVEGGSRHTLENLRGVRLALRPGHEGTPTLVTSRAHLARAGAMARGMGIGCELCGAEPALTIAEFGLVPWEAFLLHWYFTGRLVAWLIRSRRLAARVT